MRELFEYFNLPQDGGGDAPVARVVETDLFECDVVRIAARLERRGDGAGGVDGTGAVDLAVGAFAYLFEADVVGDGARGEGPAVEGVVGGAERVR